MGRGKIDTIILSIGHIGNPYKPLDMGARHEGNCEVDLVSEYVIMTWKHFASKGFKCVFMSHNTSLHRQEYANQHYDPQTSLYLDCHLNAGEGRYPMVAHTDTAMDKTKTIANLIAEQFTQKFTPDASCDTEHKMQFLPAQVWELESHVRGYRNIKKTAMSALLLEPLFIDNPAHLPIAKTPCKISSAIFDAVIAYNERVR